MYYYKGEWHVATSKIPDASGVIYVPQRKHEKSKDRNQQRRTYAELFWEVWKELNYELPTDTSMCYIFELFTKFNLNIVRTEKKMIVFHGCRSLINYEEKFPEEIKHNWIIPKRYPLKSLEEVVEACRLMNPVEQEGFVAVDAKFNRIKIKSPQFVALANFSYTGDNDRRIWEIIRTNEGSEFLSYFEDVIILLIID